MTTEATKTWNDGDIYFWSWKNRESSMWCCAGKGVVKNGFIKDTYWHGGDNVTLNEAEAEEKMHLEFVANFADLVKIRDEQAKYYARENVVCLNHPNNSGGETYVRVGSMRCQARMLEEVSYALQKAESENRSAERYVEILAKIKTSIESGDLNHFW